MGYLVRAYYSISPSRYYKDDSCWSADLKSKATEDIISIGSFVEALVLNHYMCESDSDSDSEPLNKQTAPQCHMQKTMWVVSRGVVLLMPLSLVYRVLRDLLGAQILYTIHMNAFYYQSRDEENCTLGIKIHTWKNLAYNSLSSATPILSSNALRCSCWFLDRSVYSNKDNYKFVEDKVEDLGKSREILRENFCDRYILQLLFFDLSQSPYGKMCQKEALANRYHSLDSCSSTGWQLLLKWPWRPRIKAKMMLWPAPTVLGQVAKLLAVSACWCTRTVMVEVTLGTSRFSPLIRFPVTVPGSISPACVLPFVWLLGLVISRSVFLQNSPYFLCLAKVLFLYPSIQCLSIAPAWSLVQMPYHLSQSGLGVIHRHIFQFCQFLQGTSCHTAMLAPGIVGCKLPHRCLLLLGSTTLLQSS
ncbi:hypothetical protein Tco_1125623 [Tanacetum coccineum]|uniref:Uncharacterized protein n=1 Tax=Tanacetum coccineum TaxID=301880 RepID=A0ABQ5JCI4_9ASTR